MASDQAQIDAANLNIAYCHIVAPISGRIGLRQVDQGNYVQLTDANGIVVITQLEPISVIFSTPEDNLPQIAARMKAGATLPVTVSTAPTSTSSRRDADDHRQSDRHDHRHFQTARDLRQRRRRPVSQPVRQRPPAGRHADRRRARAERGGAARPERQFRLCREGRHHGHGARRQDRPGRRQPHHDHVRPRGRRQGRHRRRRPAARRRKVMVRKARARRRRSGRGGRARSSTRRPGATAATLRAITIAMGKAARRAAATLAGSRTGAAAPAADARPGRRAMSAGRGGALREPFAPFHRTAGRDFAADDRDPAGRNRRL